MRNVLKSAPFNQCIIFFHLLCLEPRAAVLRLIDVLYCIHIYLASGCMRVPNVFFMIEKCPVMC